MLHYTSGTYFRVNPAANGDTWFYEYDSVRVTIKTMDGEVTHTGIITHLAANRMILQIKFTHSMNIYFKEIVSITKIEDHKELNMR
jgi:hypothetical protein